MRLSSPPALAALATRAASAAGVAGVALLLAACGSSSSSSTASTPASTAPASSTASASSSGASIGTATGPAGRYLTGASGRAVYLWVADTGNKSNCMGACAKVWPPVLASGTPKATGGASASDLGTVSRGGGAKQVTYMGHPLYYYAADSGPGMTKGQGSNSFGAKWWLVSTSGSAITRGGSSSTSGGSSTTSSSSSGGGGWG